MSPTIFLMTVSFLEPPDLVSLYTERFREAVRSTRYESWRGGAGAGAAGVGEAGDGGGGVDACCVVSVVRNRVVIVVAKEEEGRKSRRLGATVAAVRSGIWRIMMAEGYKIGAGTGACRVRRL